MADMLLASLDEFKTYKSIKKDENDPKLMMMLEYASNMFKEMARRSFIDYYNTPKVELHDGSTYSSLYLREFPIRDIQTVECSPDGSFSTDSTYLLQEFRDFYINRKEDTIFSKNPTLPLAPQAIPGTENIRITYTAGFKTTPPDITMAVLDLVDYQREEQFTPRKAFEGMSVENLGFRDSNSSLPAHIKRVMELYRVTV